MSKFKRIAALIVTLSMALVLLPQATETVSAATTKYYYKYTFSAQTANGGYDGTNSGALGVKFKFYTSVDGGTKNGVSINGTVSGSGITKSGETVSVTTDYISYEPWCLSSVGFTNSSTNAWRCYKVQDLKVTWYTKSGSSYNEAGSYTYAFKNGDSTHYYGTKGDTKTGTWLEDGSTNHTDWLELPLETGGSGIQTIRPTSIDGWTDFTDSIEIEVDESGGTITKTVPGTMQGSNYTGYNFWIGSYSRPEMKFEAAGTGANYKTVTWDALAKASAVEVVYYDSSYPMGFTINKKELASYMNTNAVNTITITTTIDFPWYTFCDRDINSTNKGKNLGNDKFERTITITRKALEVASVKVISGYAASVSKSGSTLQLFSYNTDGGLFNYYQDNYYLNGDSKMAVIEVQFKSAKTSEYTTWSHLRSDFFNNKTLSSIPKLLVTDGTTSTYLTEGEIYNGSTGEWETWSESDRKVRHQSGGTFRFFYRLDGLELDSGVNGVSLVFDEFSIDGYKLTEQQVDYTQSGKTAGSAVLLQSRYKVDTIAPTISASFADGGTSDDWRKVAQISYRPSENLHNTYAGNMSTSQVSSTLTYMLYSNSNKKFIRSQIAQREKASTKDYDSQTINAKSSSANTLYVGFGISDSKLGSEQQTTAYIYQGRDKAGNKIDGEKYNTDYTKLIDVKLDTLAPRATMTQTERYTENDGVKSLLFNFKVAEASKTGKVYYTFTTTADAPSYDSAEERSYETGIIDSLLGTWAYVSQSPAENSTIYTKDPTNGSAIISVEKGETFSGYLHYFTEDALGNRSSVTSKEIYLENPDIECTITADEDLSIPQNNYTINISASEGTVYYRWAYPSTNGSYIAPYKQYVSIAESAAEAGSGTQYTQDGTAVALTGECTLEVMVEIGSTQRYFTQTFNYDNAASTISFANTGSSSYKKIHTISVSASDASGIASATAGLLDSNGVTVEEYELMPIEDVVSEDVVVTGVDAGTYTLSVTVTDNNGDSTTKTSNRFYVRNAAPDTTVSVASDVLYNEETPLMASEEYKVSIVSSETFAGTVAGQHLYYRISDDMVNWGDWSDAGEMAAGVTDHSITTSIDTPYALTEGLNYFYIQTAVAPSGSSPSSDADTMDTDEVTIILDTESPYYRLHLNDVHTNETIEGTLELSDSYASEFTINMNGISSDVLTLTENEEGRSGTYSITLNGNLDSSIYVTDAVGNTTEIPILITGFDFDGPEITNDTSVVTSSGDRQDTEMTVYINDAEEGSVSFALIPAGELGSARNADGSIISSYYTDSDEFTILSGDESFTPFLTTLTSSSLANEHEDRNLTYKVALRGVTGTYYVGVKATDGLGNETEVVLDDALTAVDAEIELTDAVTVSPQLANTKTKMNLNFNMPVYILPQNMITDTADEDMTLEETNLAHAVQYATDYSESRSFIIRSTGTYELYVADNIGRSTLIEVEITDDMVSFDNTDVIEAEVYFMHGDELETEPVGDDEWAMPGYDYYDELSGEYTCSTVIVVDAPSGYYLMPENGYENWGYEYWDGDECLLFDEDYCEQYLMDPEDPTKGYSRLVYQTWWIFWEDETNGNWGYTDKYERTVYFKYKTDADDEWTDDELTVYNIDNTPPQFETKFDPETIYIDGEPALFTPGDVTLTLRVSDPQSGLEWIWLQLWTDDEALWEYVDINTAAIDPSTNVLLDNDYVTVTISGNYDENGNDLDPYGVKTVTITAHQNFYILIDAGNTIGDSGGYISEVTKENVEWIDYINKVDLSEDDYEVTYYYEDYDGNWQLVTDGVYYKNAKAVITPTSSGSVRGLYVSNNNGSNEKTLNEFDYQFTFALTDQYGYKLSVPVSLDNFDNNPGTISYSIATSGKTNQPVDITIAVSDDESGVGSVTLERKSGGTTVPIDLTDNGDGTFTGQITNTGSHIITLLDNVGNKAQQSFIVTNIDNVVPEITDISWNIADGEVTSSSVVATLSYSKTGVTITNTTPVSENFLTSDYVVDKTNSIIRFFENGSLNVYFIDEYGNEGVDVVTADQIYKDPPALTAVMTPAEDGLSVDISFEKAVDAQGNFVDPYRLLKNIMVRLNGIVKFAEEVEYDSSGTIISATPAVFTITENGVYTFDVYDMEGISSAVTVEVTGIDKSAPQITQVRWSYDYEVLENGEWQKKSVDNVTWDVGDEAGYVIATDVYPVTNSDVDVTVVTDSDTTIIGDSNSESGTEHTLTYDENGMYIFNLEKPNGMFDSYGFQVDVIDKTPPVIELAATELVFYENEAANKEPYSKSMIDEAGTAFNAYDLFKGETNLNDRVEIDYGGFNADDITQNTFDRTKPYTITYKVSDDAHNETEVTMTVRLVGENDSVAFVNGEFPDSANRAEVNDSEQIIITLGNFSGKSWARVEAGVVTMGEMKSLGEVLTETSSGSGEYVYSPEETGYYTILVQTDKRDYFNLQVFFVK